MVPVGCLVVVRQTVIVDLFRPVSRAHACRYLRLNVNEMMIVGRVSNVNLDSVFRERVVRMTEIVLTANVVIVGLVYPRCPNVNLDSTATLVRLVSSSNVCQTLIFALSTKHADHSESVNSTGVVKAAEMTRGVLARA